jgi:hypothetical protein
LEWLARDNLRHQQIGRPISRQGSVSDKGGKNHQGSPTRSIAGVIIPARKENNIMTEQTNEARQTNIFRHPMIIAALITATASIIVGLWVAWLRLPDSSKPEIYEFAVNAETFPLEKSPVEIREGDDVEIIVPGGNSTVINCGVGDTSVIGMINHEYQPSGLLPTANFCALVGRIGPESAPYLPVGAYTKFVSNMSGALYLGVNDVGSQKCSIPDCFLGNTGEIFVRVIITRK